MGSAFGERTASWAHQICHEIRFASPTLEAKTRKTQIQRGKLSKIKAKQIEKTRETEWRDRQLDRQTEGKNRRRGRQQEQQDEQRQAARTDSWRGADQGQGQPWWRHTKCMWQKRNLNNFCAGCCSKKDYVVYTICMWWDGKLAMLWPGTHAVSAVFDNCFNDT